MLVAATAAIALTPSAATASTWTPSQATVANPAQTFALAGLGGVATATSRNTLVVRAMSAGTLGEGREITLPLPGGNDLDQIASDAAGNITVASLGSLQHDVRVTRVGADGTVSGAQKLNPSGDSKHPSMAVAPDGTAVVAYGWRPAGGDRWLVMAAVRKPGATGFDAPVQLSSTAPAASKGRSRWFAPKSQIRTVAADGGRVSVAWNYWGGRGVPSTYQAVRVRSVVSADASFGRTDKVTDSASAESFSPALSDKGVLALAYVRAAIEKERTVYRARLKTAAPGATLGGATELMRVNATSGAIPDITAATSADGTTTVGVIRQASPEYTSGTVIAWTRSAAGVLSSPQTLAARSTRAERLASAAGPGSMATLAWAERARTGGVYQAPMASVRANGSSSFGEASLLSPLYGAPNVAISTAGDVIAGWNGTDPTKPLDYLNNFSASSVLAHQ